MDAQLGVGGGTSTTAADVLRDVVDFFTILVRNDRSLRRPCVGTEDDTRVVEAADDGSTGGRSGGEAEGLEGEGAVAEGVLEREAGLGRGEGGHGVVLYEESGERVWTVRRGREGEGEGKRGRDEAAYSCEGQTAVKLRTKRSALVDESKDGIARTRKGL